MAPPSADLEEEVAANGLTNGDYVHLSDNHTNDDTIGYTPVAIGVYEENPGSNGILQAEGARSQGTVVNMNGVNVTVYGNIQGLEFLNLANGGGPEVDVDAVDSEEEEEESRQRLEAERAIREAQGADLARRAAPLPPDQCQIIRNAMQGITLDFRPDWAGSIPEQEWMNRLLQSGENVCSSTRGGARNRTS